MQRLACFAKPTQLHACGDHRDGFARADAMRQQGVAIDHDAPDRVLLVRVRDHGSTHPGEVKVRAIELARNNLVELIVVQAKQCIAARVITVDPVTELVANGLPLLTCIQRCLRVHHHGAVDGHVDRGRLLVESSFHQHQRAALVGAPLRFLQRVVAHVLQVVAGRLDTPRCRGGVKGDRQRVPCVIHKLGGELLHHLNWNPRCPQARFDFCWAEIGGQDFGQRLDVFLVRRTGGSRLTDLFANVARQVLICRHPTCEHRVAKRDAGGVHLLDHFHHRLTGAKRHVFEDDLTVEGQTDQHRILRGVHPFRQHRLANSASRENVSLLGLGTLIVPDLQREHQRPVGVTPHHTAVGRGAQEPHLGHVRVIGRPKTLLQHCQLFVIVRASLETDHRKRGVPDVDHAQHALARGAGVQTIQIEQFFTLAHADAVVTQNERPRCDLGDVRVTRHRAHEVGHAGVCTCLVDPFRNLGFHQMAEHFAHFLNVAVEDWNGLLAILTRLPRQLAHDVIGVSEVVAVDLAAHLCGAASVAVVDALARRFVRFEQLLLCIERVTPNR